MDSWRKCVSHIDHLPILNKQVSHGFLVFDRLKWFISLHFLLIPKAKQENSVIWQSRFG